MGSDIKFIIRIIFYILILAALIWVGIQGGGDPCEKCQLQVEGNLLLEDRPYTCREIIENYFIPEYVPEFAQNKD